MNRIASACCACLTLIGSSGAFASQNKVTDSLEPPPSRRVNYGDLDLTRDPGVAALYSRIRAAAYSVCPRERDWADKWIERAETCRFQAVARAVADVNAPQLTSYYEAKTRGR